MVSIKHFLAFALLSANSAAVLADINVSKTVTAEGTVTVNADSDLSVEFNGVGDLTVDNIKAGAVTKVISFTTKATSGLVASAFTTPVSPGNPSCTNAKGSTDGNNTIEVCIDPNDAAGKTISIGGKYYVRGQNGVTYHLYSSDKNKEKEIKADTYKISLDVVNFTE